MPTGRTCSCLFLSTLMRALLFLLILPYLCEATLRNATVDDTHGGNLPNGVTIQPVFTPDIQWANASCGDLCDVQPDQASAFDGTWRQAVYKPSMKNISLSLNFAGSGIYIYFILEFIKQDGATRLPRETLCNFTLDGEFQKTFHHIPPLDAEHGPPFLYNQLAFSAWDLDQSKRHTLTASITGKQDQEYWMAFDYAIVTFNDTLPPYVHPQSAFSSGDDDDDEDANRPVKLATIVSSALGGAMAVVIVFCLYILFRRRKQRRERAKSGFLLPKDGSPKTMEEAPPRYSTGGTLLSRSTSRATTVSRASTMSSTINSYPSVINVPPLHHSVSRHFSQALSSSGVAPSIIGSETGSSDYFSTYHLREGNENENVFLRARVGELEQRVKELEEESLKSSDRSSLVYTDTISMTSETLTVRDWHSKEQ